MEVIFVKFKSFLLGLVFVTAFTLTACEVAENLQNIPMSLNEIEDNNVVLISKTNAQLSPAEINNSNVISNDTYLVEDVPGNENFNTLEF